MHLLRRNKKQYVQKKEEARRLVLERIAYHNNHFGYPLKRVSIKNHKSRWGSCSAKGNLNFNYKLVYLPLEVVDYVVVHELCHLKEFNHSKSFWALVAQRIPQYVEVRRMLRDLERASVQKTPAR